MKILNGAELRDFIKERQAKQVRALRQSWRVFPKLVIFYSSSSKVVETYMRLKQQYGEDILIDVEPRRVDPEEMQAEIEVANNDDAVHGIIVQLPLEDSEGRAVSQELRRQILNSIAPNKDVDGLGQQSEFASATALAINWLLAGYNIELSNKKIAIVGQGILVGQPLAKIWQKSGYDVTTFDERTADQMRRDLPKFDVVVSATGVGGLITSDLLKPKAIVVDAGTASEGGKIVGDVAPEVRQQRADLTITPEKGGVGPLTIALLLDNVIIAARRVAEVKGQQDLPS